MCQSVNRIRMSFGFCFFLHLSIQLLFFCFVLILVKIHGFTLQIYTNQVKCVLLVLRKNKSLLFFSYLFFLFVARTECFRNNLKEEMQEYAISNILKQLKCNLYVTLNFFLLRYASKIHSFYRSLCYGSVSLTHSTMKKSTKSNEWWLFFLCLCCKYTN